MVLDPFCGSGTAGVVALKLGRHFIGTELSEPYCAMARRRIGEVAPLLAGRGMSGHDPYSPDAGAVGVDSGVVP